MNKTLKNSPTNHLFPVFLQLENLRLLIVGGGQLAEEKLETLLANSPDSSIKLVSLQFNEAIFDLANEHPNIKLVQKKYEKTDLDEIEMVIVAINDVDFSMRIKKDAKQKGKLINLADNPELSDFHLGEEIDEVLKNLQSGHQNDEVTMKVQQSNELTKLLVAKQTTLEEQHEPAQKRWQEIVKWCLFAFFFMIVGHGIFSYVSFEQIVERVQLIPQKIDTKMFLMMLLTGFFAQMADGSLGMGYGTISTTFLLAIGVSPAIVSSRVHSARVFSAGVSGYSHHRFGNINKKLFMALVIPGVIGAIAGATLAFFAQKYSSVVRIPLSFYTIYLGYFIIRKAFIKKTNLDKVTGAGWLASAGGFTDAFAGGGWGSLVTSTLISKRKNPRYVIGSVCLAEFFVVLASSITFFIFLKSIPLVDVAGLILGGLIAAPIAARLVGKLPLKTMFILVGTLVILTSTNTLWRAISTLLVK